MKSLALAALLSLAPAAVTAQEVKSSDPTRHTCEIVGSIAESIMRGRQAGEKLSEAMRMLVLDPTLPPAVSELNREMVLAAFQAPLFSTEQYRSETIAEFRITYESACYLAGVE